MNSFFPDHLSKYMDKKGLNDTKLAAKVGMTRGMVGKWKKGENRPKLSTFIKLCEIFNCTPNDLIIGNSYDSSMSVLEEEQGGDDSEQSVTHLKEVIKRQEQHIIDLRMNLEDLRGHRPTDEPRGSPRTEKSNQTLDNMAQ